jgi:hypothetical protein
VSECPHRHIQTDRQTDRQRERMRERERERESEREREIERQRERERARAREMAAETGVGTETGAKETVLGLFWFYARSLVTWVQINTLPRRVHRAIRCAGEGLCFSWPL